MLNNFLWKSSIVGVYWSSNLSLRNREIMAVFPTLVEPKITIRWQFLAGMLNSFSDGDIFFIIFAPERFFFKAITTWFSNPLQRCVESNLAVSLKPDWDQTGNLCRIFLPRLRASCVTLQLGELEQNYNVTMAVGVRQPFPFHRKVENS